MLEKMLSTKVIDDVETSAKIRDALLRKHKHQYEQQKLDLIKSVRSLADIGRQFSNARNFQISNDSGVQSNATSTANSSLNVEKSSRTNEICVFFKFAIFRDFRHKFFLDLNVAGNVPKVFSMPKDFQTSSTDIASKVKK